MLVAWDPAASGERVLHLLDTRMQAHNIVANPLPQRTIRLTGAPVYVVASGIASQDIEKGIRIERAPGIDERR